MNYEKLVKEANKEGVDPHIIAHEQIQKIILKTIAIQKSNVELTLHGGTSLRVLHGSPRRSLDIDLSTEQEIEYGKLVSKLEEEVSKELLLLNTDCEITQKKSSADGMLYRFFIVTKEEIPELGKKVKVKLEILKTKNLKRERTELRVQEPIATIVPIWSKTLDEMLVDKICAFGGRTHVSPRDIYDMWFIQNKGIKLNSERLMIRFGEWKETVEKLNRNYRQLQENTIEELQRQVNSLLPRTRQLREGETERMKEAVQDIIQKALEELERR